MVGFVYCKTVVGTAVVGCWLDLVTCILIVDYCDVCGGCCRCCNCFSRFLICCFVRLACFLWFAVICCLLSLARALCIFCVCLPSVGIAAVDVLR